MVDSIKMAKLDYYTIKSQLLSNSSILLIILMYRFMDSSLLLLGIVAAVFSTIQAPNTFLIQEKNDLERLYASLSIDVKNIIGGRYISIFATYMIALLFALVVESSFSVFQNNFVGVREIITAMCVSICIFTVIVGIQIPMCFRYGFTKAKTRCVIPILFMSAALILSSFSTGFSSMIAVAINHQMILNVVCVTVSLVTLFVSYHASISNYQKRK